MAKKIVFAPDVARDKFSLQSTTGHLWQKKDSIFYRKSFFSFYPKIFNNYQRLGKAESVMLFRLNNLSFDYYRKYRQQYKVSLYSFAGTFAGIVVSSLAFDNGKRPLAGTGLIFSLGVWVNSIVFAKRVRQISRKLSDHSINSNCIDRLHQAQWNFISQILF